MANVLEGTLLSTFLRNIFSQICIIYSLIIKETIGTIQILYYESNVNYILAPWNYAKRAKDLLYNLYGLEFWVQHFSLRRT